MAEIPGQVTVKVQKIYGPFILLRMMSGLQAITVMFIKPENQTLQSLTTMSAHLLMLIQFFLLMQVQDLFAEVKVKFTNP